MPVRNVSAIDNRDGKSQWFLKIKKMFFVLWYFMFFLVLM